MRFFDYALARCGCAPDDVLFIGNQLNTDIAGANRARIRSVWLAGDAYRSDDDRPCDADADLHDPEPLGSAGAGASARAGQLGNTRTADSPASGGEAPGAMSESGRAVHPRSQVVVFERHATSLDNEAGLASGWFDVGLSPRGEQQARELGERRRRGAFAAVYCSDLHARLRVLPNSPSVNAASRSCAMPGCASATMAR